MKISILLPTLFPPLADRLIKNIWQSELPVWCDLEIVVASPMQIFGKHIVWCRDEKPSGTNPAMRMAFEASSGDLICSLADDFSVNPDWLLKSVPALDFRNDVVLALDGGMFSCFGYRYAISPLTTRTTVKRHWRFYFPYVSHWGDPAFSMDMWRTGGGVLPMPDRRGVVNWGLDRMGHGESVIKESSFKPDQVRFLADFGDMGSGYDLSGDWHLYNGVYPCRHDP